MTQRPGAPPEEWERRKGDESAKRSTQLIVDGQNELAAKVDALGGELVQHREIIKTELAHYLSHKQLWAYLAIMLGLGYWFYAQVKALTDGIRAENTASNLAQLEQQRKHDEAERQEHEWLRKKVNGSSHFLEDKPEPKRRKER